VFPPRLMQPSHRKADSRRLMLISSVVAAAACRCAAASVCTAPRRGPSVLAHSGSKRRGSTKRGCGAGGGIATRRGGETGTGSGRVAVTGLTSFSYGPILATACHPCLTHNRHRADHSLIFRDRCSLHPAL